jgi:hypothetical protein
MGEGLRPYSSRLLAQSKKEPGNGFFFCLFCVKKKLWAIAYKFTKGMFVYDEENPL